MRAGYLTDRVTFFIWEGVTYYIPEEAVRSTLRVVATASAPGSAIVFDGKGKSFIDFVAASLAAPDKVPPALQPALAQPGADPSDGALSASQIGFVLEATVPRR